MATEISVNPNMLIWAIARAGHAVDEYLHQFPAIKEWVDQVKKPTVKQLEKLAKKLHLPFGYLFLQTPPQENIPFPFFRTLGQTNQKTNLNVYDTILILQRRQDWLTEYLIENDEAPLIFVGKFNANTDYLTIVNDIRETLSISAEWANGFATVEESLNFIARRIEGIGIMVNFNGVVENNNYRPIAVEECRGFVLVNTMAPFMFINAGDAKAAQLFTIIHELAHVWLGESAGFDNKNLMPADDPLEKLCDMIAAEFLVPTDSFNRLWNHGGDIVRLSRYFKVSQVVIARRALDLGKISKREFFAFYNNYMLGIRQKKEAQSGGGDFYATARKRVGVSFAAYVDQAVKQNKLLYRDAYKITGLRGDTYQNFVTKHLF